MRQLQVAVAARPAVAREVFHHRQDAAIQQPVDHRPPQRDHDRRIGRESAVADHVMAAGNRHIEHRQAVDIDADIGQIAGDQPGVEISRFAGDFGGILVQLAEHALRRPFGPFWRLQARHPAAFLINQHWRFGVADGIAQRRGKRSYLGAGSHVAAEQDKAPRLHLAEEIPLLRLEHGARTAKNHPPAHDVPISLRGNRGPAPSSAHTAPRRCSGRRTSRSAADTKCSRRAFRSAAHQAQTH